MRQHFRIRRTAERVPALFQIRAQLPVVINLAIQDDGDLSVLAQSRLLARREVNDREPSHAERDARLGHQPFRVRPAMRHPRAHRTQQLLRALRLRRPRIHKCPSGNPTHKKSVTSDK